MKKPALSLLRLTPFPPSRGISSVSSKAHTLSTSRRNAWAHSHQPPTSSLHPDSNSAVTLTTVYTHSFSITTHSSQALTLFDSLHLNSFKTKQLSYFCFKLDFFRETTQSLQAQNFSPLLFSLLSVMKLWRFWGVSEVWSMLTSLLVDVAAVPQLFHWLRQG